MAQPFRNAYKRGDLVRVTEDVQKLIETQWAPEDFANAAAGKYMRIEAAYKDLSYDLDGTPLKLDGSVLEYIGHPKKAEVRKCGHVYADGFHGAQVCVKCLDPKNESILI